VNLIGLQPKLRARINQTHVFYNSCKTTFSAECSRAAECSHAMLSEKTSKEETI